jgi:hypothetical protein
MPFTCAEINWPKPPADDPKLHFGAVGGSCGLTVSMSADPFTSRMYAVPAAAPEPDGVAFFPHAQRAAAQSAKLRNFFMIDRL